MVSVASRAKLPTAERGRDARHLRKKDASKRSVGGSIGRLASGKVSAKKDLPRTSSLTQLTPGESLWLWRRRKGWTQQQAAAHCRVCFDTIARAEYDIGGNVVFELLENNLKSILPTLPEALRLARRRTALLQGVGNQQVATDAGVSRPTLLAAERAAAPWLIDYWHSLGFRFPIK